MFSGLPCETHMAYVAHTAESEGSAGWRPYSTYSTYSKDPGESGAKPGTFARFCATKNAILTGCICMYGLEK